MATLNTVKEIDPRIIRLFKKKAMRKTLPMVVIFAVIMLIIHDLYVALFWGFFFGIFWYIAYNNAIYILLANKYPNKFSPFIYNNGNDMSESLKKWNLDIINNPAYQGLSCNIYHKR